jgi:hypothetical protein
MIAKANLFAAPDSLLKNVNDVLSGHPKRMGVMIELFEAQHHHTQGAYETWVRKRIKRVLDEDMKALAAAHKKRGAR